MTKLHPYDLACYDSVAAVVGQSEAMEVLQNAIDNDAILEGKEDDIILAIGWAFTATGIDYWADLRQKINQGDKWQEGEDRMNNIGTNGNEGEHYKAMNKYSKEIKKGVLVDVYDVLNAFAVVNPATAHAIKKLLMPGKRGAKDAIQDLKEARDSLDRAIELELEVLK